jgi:hypothetical protein
VEFAAQALATGIVRGLAIMRYTDFTIAVFFWPLFIE